MPYLVSIQLEDWHVCSGNIISKDWILTDAECITQPTSKYQVRVGSKRTDQGGKLHPVAEFITHEDFHIDNFVPINNIALVRLNESITFDQNTQPIELFKANESARIGAMASVSGWGEIGVFASTLRSVAVPVYSKERCIETLFKGLQSGAQICAGSAGAAANGECQRDLGSPLSINGRLAGIPAWEPFCTDSPDKYPSIYTQVSHYRAWIKNKCNI